MNLKIVKFSDPVNIRIPGKGTAFSVMNTDGGFLLRYLPGQGVLIGHKKDPSIAELVPSARCSHMQFEGGWAKVNAMFDGRDQTPKPSQPVKTPKVRHGKAEV
jgi:hypothetical protein